MFQPAYSCEEHALEVMVADIARARRPAPRYRIGDVVSTTHTTDHGQRCRVRVTRVYQLYRDLVYVVGEPPTRHYVYEVSCPHGLSLMAR